VVEDLMPGRKPEKLAENPAKALLPLPPFFWLIFSALLIGVLFPRERSCKTYAKADLWRIDTLDHVTLLTRRFQRGRQFEFVNVR